MRQSSLRSRLLIIALILAGLIGFLDYHFFYAERHPSTDWAEYNGDAARDHYSSLAQINTGNVRLLKLAWTYSSGGADTTGNHTQMQCNPLIIGGILYGVNAASQPFALDARNGREIWKAQLPVSSGTTSRGVSFYPGSGNRQSRIFFGAGRWLYALDAKNGRPIRNFGDSGRIDLKRGLERPGADAYVVSNTPNVIYKNLIIVGVRVNESESALLGDIRAYDVHNGTLVWTFATIPNKGDTGYNTWLPEPRQHIGAANSWAGMAIDRENGIVYAPTGSAAFDFYGGNRTGDNLFANCLLALDAATGKRRWHFQLVHHDIWDRDPPAPPNLLTVMHNGKSTPAVAQVTKQGFVFLFNRLTGEPLFPITETAFPQTAVEGEHPSPTQPVPVLPEPFTRQSFTAADFNNMVSNRDSLVRLLASANTGSPFIPLGHNLTIIFPGTDGGAQWGGAATDTSGIMYIPSKEIPVYTSLVSATADNETAYPSRSLFMHYCAACHGKDMAGSHDGTYPSLLNAGTHLNAVSIGNLLQQGRGMMPSFAQLTTEQRNALINFVLHPSANNNVALGKDSTQKLPFRHTGYNRWYDKNGYPVNTPPWGTLTAMDLNTGKRKWQVPLGEYPELTAKGIPPTGTDNYGGPLVTGGNLIFIAATRDEQFRAMDKATGKILWQTALPAAGYASPSTYSVNGKQYIVIACGGGKLNTKSGDKYVAFCLE